MINSILTAAGIPHSRGRFARPPASTYAVYMDDLTVDGADRVAADRLPGIVTHDVTIELYEAEPDDKAEAAIEAALDDQGLPWTKQDRYWLQDALRYQVVYEFTYNEKRRT